MKKTIFTAIFFVITGISASEQLYPERKPILGAGLYFEKINVLLLHCPKCASTFLRNTFHQPGKWVNASKFIQEGKNPIILLAIRHPYSRTISSYFELLKARTDGPREVTMKKEFFQKRNNLNASFDLFLDDTKNNGPYDIHCVPQWIVFNKKGIDLSQVTFIIDVDSIEDDLRIFSKHFRIPVDLNVDKYSSSREKKGELIKRIFGNSHTKELIDSICFEDLNFYFGCKKIRTKLIKG